MCADPIDPIDDKPQKSRFKSLKCSAKNETIVEFKFCRVKVFSRTSSGLAVNVTFKESLKRPIFVKLNMNYKYGTIYRRIFDVPEIELCSTLKNVKKAPPFVKAFIEVLGDSIARLLEGCPYFGDLILLAEFDDSKWPSIFPTGSYRMDFTVRLADRSVLMTVVPEFEMISAIKTSF
jgi:Protein of unknown function (DUF1091)